MSEDGGDHPRVGDRGQHTKRRVISLCFVFAPTHTRGGNGQMLSVALYDMISSVFGADPVYARQALINVAVASAVLGPVAVLIAYLERCKRVRRESRAETGE